MRVARLAFAFMRLFLLAAWCVAATGSALFAQVAAGEITGILKDQGGAAVPGATVTVTNVGTNRQRIVLSTGEGVYTAPSLAPGEYRVDVELPGFKPMRRAGIRLSTGEKARIDFDLAVGDVREQVTVTADAPILRTETGSLGTVVEHEQIVQLPLNGRTFITLASLAPGVALPPNSQFPRINGGRPRTNEYLFDGISVLQPEPGQVAYLSGDRRDSGVQDREQQSARRIRPLQRWRDQPDHQVGHECLSRRADSSSSGTKDSTRGISFSPPIR